jgi:hypothetical protein
MKEAVLLALPVALASQKPAEQGKKRQKNRFSEAAEKQYILLLFLQRGEAHVSKHY